MGFKRDDSGEVMVEGMIILLLTMITLVWLLALGFLYYQRYILTAITNDAACKVADTYSYPSSDIVIGYTQPSEFTHRDLYRTFSNDSFEETFKERAKTYIIYRLKKTNLLNTIDAENVEVDAELVLDSGLRRHIEVKTTCQFNTPFGFVMPLFGMDSKFTYSTMGRADCTDKMEYIAVSDFYYRVLSASDVKSKALKMVNSISSLVYKLIDRYNHSYN